MPREHILILLWHKKERLPFPVSLNIIIVNSAELRKMWERQPPISYVEFAPDIYAASKLSGIKKAHCIS